MEKLYLWSVTLNGRTVEVQAADKLTASQAAARKLGVRWSQTARDMDVLRLRRARA